MSSESKLSNHLFETFPHKTQPTMIGQSVHEDSEQPPVGRENQE